MGLSQMMELLQTKEKGKIVLLEIGSFYIARGKVISGKIADNMEIEIKEIEKMWN